MKGRTDASPYGGDRTAKQRGLVKEGSARRYNDVLHWIFFQQRGLQPVQEATMGPTWELRHNKTRIVCQDQRVSVHTLSERTT